jgi:hypothetical protein
MGITALWWSATEFDASIAYYRYLDYSLGDLGRDLFSLKSGGSSVRLLRDE